MNWVYKFVQTFSFKQKHKLLKTLTYQGDDMLEDPEVYQQVFDMINTEEKENEHNQDKNSIINLILAYAKDINGDVNYVFKTIGLLVRGLETGKILLAQNFLDFYPLGAISNDLNVYKKNFRETVADAALHIFSISGKVCWVEAKQINEEDYDAKISKLSTLIMHHGNIVVQVLKVTELIQEITDSNELQNDQSFMYLFEYSLNTSVHSYTSLIDYSQMLLQAALDGEIKNDEIKKVVKALVKLEGISKKYYTSIDTYQYMIEGASAVIDNNEQYSFKRIDALILAFEALEGDTSVIKQPQPSINEEEKQP